MESKRVYGDGCAVAHALDMVGERWALLIVRELLFGPRRFTDLRTGLSGASSNVLSQRLRELEWAGVVRRRRMGPPVGSWVYELTDQGRELEPILIALGRWGRGSPRRRPDAMSSASSLALALKTHFDPVHDRTLTATYEIRLGVDRFQVRVEDGDMTVVGGEASGPDATIDGDTDAFAELVTGRASVEDLVAAGRLALAGDRRLVARLADCLATAAPGEGRTRREDGRRADSAT